MVNSKLVKDINGAMKKLIEELNNARNRYYNYGDSPLSDSEYDKKLFELEQMEKESGIIYANSPTQTVGFEVLNNIDKISIEDKPMLSLQKVYSPEEIKKFQKNYNIFGMIKCDGVSVRLIYENGELVSANTRGNGYIGSNITNHAKHFINLPLSISNKNRIIIDGEAIIKSFDFEIINQSNEFSNPRNAVAGSLNLLDMQIVHERRISLIVWDVIEGVNINSVSERLNTISSYGFEIVPIYSDDTPNYDILMDAKLKGIPCDGVVWKIDDVIIGNSLGQTSHHFMNAVAWKPANTIVSSILRDIEFSMGRSGVLTPVAIFDEVELLGSIISRASLHNIDIMRDSLQCENGIPIIPQKVYIFKANDIIPQIDSSEMLDESYSFVNIPSACPYCGAQLSLQAKNISTFLLCENPTCSGRLINKLDHFCGKSGLDIKGLSKATLDKLIDWGWVKTFADIFNLKNHAEEWKSKPGFGEASVSKILDAVEVARTTSTHESFISAIGIPLIGRTMVKELMKNGITTYQALYNLVQQGQDFSQFNGFGYEKSESLLKFDYSEANEAYALMNLVIPEPEEKEENLAGKSIVITGTLKQFKNRAQLQAVIEAAGGKVVGSISKNTSFLINNDINSTSAKNQAAKKLGIPILSEEDFLKII